MHLLWHDCGICASLLLKAANSVVRFAIKNQFHEAHIDPIDSGFFGK